MRAADLVLGEQRLVAATRERVARVDGDGDDEISESEAKEARWREKEREREREASEAKWRAAWSSLIAALSFLLSLADTWRRGVAGGERRGRASGGEDEQRPAPRRDDVQENYNTTLSGALVSERAPVATRGGGRARRREAEARNQRRRAGCRREWGNGRRRAAWWREGKNEGESTRAG